MKASACGPFCSVRYTVGFSVAVVLSAITFITPNARAQVNRDINSYVLFAYDQLTFKGGGNIIGGNIGVQNADPDLDDGEFMLNFATSAAASMSVGSQAAADSVRADTAGTFWDLYTNKQNPSFGATISGSGPTAYSLPTVNNAPAFPFTGAHTNLTNAASDTNVAQGVTLTLAPGTYRDVRFNDDTVITLQAGVYDMRNLSMGMDVTVIVDENTILNIDRQFDPNNRLMFGVGSNSGAHIFVAGFGLNPDTTAAVQLSHEGEVHGQFFAPTGFLNLGGDNEHFGRFWALRISGDPGNNVTFVPEPTTCVLVGFGLAGLFAFGARKRHP